MFIYRYIYLNIITFLMVLKYVVITIKIDYVNFNTKKLYV